MRRCAWCRAELSATVRIEARTCCQRCRQALWRFERGRQAHEAAAQPLRLAYADPPYPGLARRYYGQEPDYQGEVDHGELLSRLATYDGWALSTSSEALLDLASRLAGADGVRVASWHRGSRHGRASRPAQAWEPVIYRPARAVVMDRPPEDALVAVARPRRAEARVVTGMKPAAYLWWVLDLIGARPGDELDDLFPGSGGMGRAWELYGSRRTSGDVSRAGAKDVSTVDLDDGGPVESSREVACPTTSRLSSCPAPSFTPSTQRL